MDRWRDFAPGADLPTTWTDGIESLLGNYVSPNWRVVAASPATGVQVVAGANDQAIGLMVRGKPRWATSSVVAAHPGGAAGLYNVYAVTDADAFSTSPGPPSYEVNATTGFRLEILPVGSTPTSSALYRKVATCYWSGSVVVAVINLVGAWAPIEPIVGPLLPKSPANGLVIRYAYAGANADHAASWRLRWLSSAAKWIFLGGPWAYAKNSGTTTNNGSTWVMTGASLVVPLAGEYDVQIKGQTGGLSGTVPKIGASVDGADPLAANTILFAKRATQSKIVRLTLAAGSTVRVAVANDGLGGQVFSMMNQVSFVPHTVDPI